MNTVKPLITKSIELVVQKKAIDDALTTQLIALCTHWCEQLKGGMSKVEVLAVVDGHQSLLASCSEEDVEVFAHWLNVYTNHNSEDTITEDQAIYLKELFSVRIGELVLNKKPEALQALCVDVELDPEIEMASKNIEVKITFANKEYTFDSVLEVLEDYEFTYIVDDCGYSDTGGGWRDTYRRLLKPMVREFVREPKRIEQTSEYPHIIIEAV